MKQQILLTLTVGLVSMALLSATRLHAEDRAESFCPDASLSTEFVKQAIVICMQDVPSQRSACMRDAETQFQRCHLNGNFRRISSRVQTKLIMLSLFRNLVSPLSDRYKVASNER